VDIEKLPEVDAFPNNGIIGPTVKYEDKWTPGETTESLAPCHLAGYLVSKSCLDCPLSLCKHDNLAQARAEVKALAQKGELWRSTESSEDQ